MAIISLTPSPDWSLQQLHCYLHVMSICFECNLYESKSSKGKNKNINVQRNICSIPVTNNVHQQSRTFQPEVTSVYCWDGQHPGKRVFTPNTHVWGLEKWALKKNTYIETMPGCDLITATKLCQIFMRFSTVLATLYWRMWNQSLKQ